MNKKLFMHSSKAVGLSKHAHALPTALSSILKECKEYNMKNGITGAIYYNQGYFQQIIEGEIKAVNGLMLNILKDKRHTDCVIQLEIKINEHVFPNWQRQLGVKVRQDPHLRAFIVKYSEQLKAMKPEARIAFKQFLNRHSGAPSDQMRHQMRHQIRRQMRDQTKIINKAKNVIQVNEPHYSNVPNVFGDKILLLKNVPEHENIELPPVMYNLCRLLTRTPQSVDQLVEGFGADKRDNILNLLKQLNSNGLLKFQEDQRSSTF